MEFNWFFWFTVAAIIFLFSGPGKTVARLVGKLVGGAVKMLFPILVLTAIIYFFFLR